MKNDKTQTLRHIYSGNNCGTILTLKLEVFFHSLIIMKYIW